MSGMTYYKVSGLDLGGPGGIRAQKPWGPEIGCSREGMVGCLSQPNLDREVLGHL